MSISEIYRDGGEAALTEYLLGEGASSEDIEAALMYCEDYPADEND